MSIRRLEINFLVHVVVFCTVFNSLSVLTNVDLTMSSYVALKMSMYIITM